MNGGYNIYCHATIPYVKNVHVQILSKSLNGDD